MNNKNNFSTNKNNFSTDQFNQIQKIREEFRHTETPKEIYGILSILLHDIARKIVNIDDLGAITEDLYPLLLRVSAECQYGAEQLQLIDPQLSPEQIEKQTQDQIKIYYEMLDKLYTETTTKKPKYEEIQKGQPPIKYYELSDEVIRGICDIIKNNLI
jgi:hypothetical protein